MRPLLDLIFDTKFNPASDAAFTEARKLLLAHNALKLMMWRIRPRAKQELDVYLHNLQHPYKQVREVIGGNINIIFKSLWVPTICSLDDWAKQVGSREAIMETSESEAADQRFLSYALDFLDRSEQSSEEPASKNYVNACKTGENQRISVVSMYSCATSTVLASQWFDTLVYTECHSFCGPAVALYLPDARITGRRRPY